MFSDEKRTRSLKRHACVFACVVIIQNMKEIPQVQSCGIPALFKSPVRNKDILQIIVIVCAEHLFACSHIRKIEAFESAVSGAIGTLVNQLDKEVIEETLTDVA